MVQQKPVAVNRGGMTMREWLELLVLGGQPAIDQVLAAVARASPSHPQHGALGGAEEEVLTEAHDEAATFLLATPIGPLAVDEAGFGPTFPVTPYMAWDNGEVSGPYDNWKRVRLTVEHLMLAIESLNDLQRAVFYTEIWRRRHEREGG